MRIFQNIIDEKNNISQIRSKIHDNIIIMRHNLVVVVVRCT